MKHPALSVFLAATLVLAPQAAWGQGGYGRGGMGSRPYYPAAPKLPGVELTGPLDTTLAPTLLTLSPDQAKRYTQAYDSFMTATRPERDSANAAIAKMNSRLDDGDRGAAEFYAERVQEWGKFLRDQQDRFESDLRRILNGDQVKAYKKWRDTEDQKDERKRRENEVRWQEAGVRGEFGGPRAAPAADLKTSLPAAAGVPAPPLGSQAVRLGRTIYVAGQLGVDSLGTLAGTDLAAQAARAFANLTTVLRAAGATSRDVTALTIYVVNYRPPDLATIREAGASYLGANAPIVTVLGVESVGRDGALIAIGATATAAH